MNIRFAGGSLVLKLSSRSMEFKIVDSHQLAPIKSCIACMKIYSSIRFPKQERAQLTKC
ncbi:hypothetical protein Peur_059916 [Populus x canadensis]